MATLDSRIDDLYQVPFDEFIAARATLASELKGDEAKRVRQLKKPASAPWAVNQLYWRARGDFDRVLKSGAALRRAQIAALEGRSADLRAATQTHREAVAAAVTKAMALADAAKVKPNRDALTQTFEALSLAAKAPESPGRLTQPLRPGGFEMLTGVEPAANIAPKVTPKPKTTITRKTDATASVGSGGLQADKTRSEQQRLQADQKRARAEQRQAAIAARARERELATAARERQAAIKKAEAALERARAAEEQAEHAWRKAQEDVERAGRVLRQLKSSA